MVDDVSSLQVGAWFTVLMEVQGGCRDAAPVAAFFPSREMMAMVAVAA